MKVHKKSLIISLSALAVIAIFARYLVVPAIQIASINHIVESIQQRPGFEGSTVVVDAKYEGSETSIIDQNSDVLIHPGSNYKLLTAAASLFYLTPEFTFKTNFSTFTVKGKTHLIIEGRGDPTFHLDTIQKIAAEIVKTGMRIDGNIYYDDRYFRGEPYGPGWKDEWKDIHFGVPIAALQIDDNILYIQGAGSAAKDNLTISTASLKNYAKIIDERTVVTHDAPYTITATMGSDGIVTLHGETSGDNAFSTATNIYHPSLVTAEVFRQELSALGLCRPAAFVGSIEELDHTPGAVKLLYTHVSDPLSTIVQRMLTFSKNNYGETLIRVLGEEVAATSGGKDTEGQATGSQAKGVEVLTNFLFHEVQLPAGEFIGRDGSGMSPSSRITGRAIIQLFEYINKQPWKDVYWSALPTSNNEGTLHYRFLDLNIPDLIIAKTGTHDFSSSLSGKIPRAHDTILFSIHIFQHHIPAENIGIAVHPVIDYFVKLLDERL